MSNKKVFISSDSPFTNTGFSSQSLFLANYLSNNYEVHYQSHNYPGQMLPKGSVKLADGTPFNFNLYGAGKEQYSKDLLVPRIREIKPNYFITLLDTFMVYPWYLQLDFAPAKTIFWYPSDGGGCLPVNCEEILRKVHCAVAMSKFGQKQAKEIHGIDVEYIPHAINPKTFFPLSKQEKETIKTKYGLQGKFVIGLMGRNQGRKMHDRAIKMFAKWCKKHQDVVLFMHLDPDDIAAVFNIRAMVRRLGIQNRVFYSGNKYYQGVTYQQMNEIYNVMDIYISGTSGEGFGIGTIEAMACQIPVLNTAYTTTDELVTNNNAGEAIKLVGTEYVNIFDINQNEYDYQMMNGTITGSWNVERGIIDINDGVEKLEKLYQDKELRKTYGENGRKAVLKEYTWDVVGKMWTDLLKKLE